MQVLQDGLLAAGLLCLAVAGTMIYRNYHARDYQKALRNLWAILASTVFLTPFYFLQHYYFAFAIALAVLLIMSAYMMVLRSKHRKGR